MLLLLTLMLLLLLPLQLRHFKLLKCGALEVLRALRKRIGPPGHRAAPRAQVQQLAQRRGQCEPTRPRPNTRRSLLLLLLLCMRMQLLLLCMRMQLLLLLLLQLLLLLLLSHMYRLSCRA